MLALIPSSPLGRVEWVIVDFSNYIYPTVQHNSCSDFKMEYTGELNANEHDMDSLGECQSVSFSVFS